MDWPGLNEMLDSFEEWKKRNSKIIRNITIKKEAMHVKKHDHANLLNNMNFLDYLQKNYPEGRIYYEMVNF